MNKSRQFGYSEQYENSRSALERETAALLAERNRLQAGYQDSMPQIRPVFQESTAITPVALTKIQSENKTNQVVSKLQQIIQLCRQEGSLSNQQMNEVVKVENEVLHYLQRTTGEEAAIKPSSPQPSQTYQKSQLYQPSQPYQFPQPVYQQSATKSRTEATTNYPPIPQTWGKEPQNKGVKTMMSDDTLQIIGVIQRRALSEIVNLQQERDNIKRQRDIFAAQLERLKHQFTKLSSGQPGSQPPLIVKESQREDQRFSRIDAGEIERLRQENRILRQENHMLKEDNQYLNSRIQILNQTIQQQARDTHKTQNRSTYPENLPKNSNLAYGQYDSQIAVYENQLKRASVVINELRSRLANVPGLEELHDQGQRIRIETTKLLQLKGGHQNQGAVIRELQERLSNEERGKAAFFEELKAFKQKYLQLQEENRNLKKSKVSFDPVARAISNSPPKDSYSNRGIIKKKGNLGEFEQTLNEMKNVLY